MPSSSAPTSTPDAILARGLPSAAAAVVVVVSGADVQALMRPSTSVLASRRFMFLSRYSLPVVRPHAAGFPGGVIDRPLAGRKAGRNAENAHNCAISQPRTGETPLDRHSH